MELFEKSQKIILTVPLYLIKLWDKFMDSEDTVVLKYEYEREFDNTVTFPRRIFFNESYHFMSKFCLLYRQIK